MDHGDHDKLALIADVIRVVENVRRRRPREDSEEWAQDVAESVADARDMLGSFGEGKALSSVVALCTEFLEWGDLREVGVEPMSEPPWKVLQDDLVDPSRWCDVDRRGRVLKILRKLSHHLQQFPDAEETDAAWVSVIRYSEERGVLPDTLRRRLRNFNERASKKKQIRVRGVGEKHRPLYAREDLAALLTADERARCRV